MPRAPRVHVHSGVYHTILRGNHRNAIFCAPRDRDEFEEILGQALERFQSHILAYCWMTNHIHAIVQVADRPLGHLVQLVASRYARRFQQRVPTSGHLFERRYRARLIADADYLRQAIRYIHLNPVKADIVRDPAEYRWSSHRCYVGAPAPGWLSVDQALGCFGGSRREAVAAYVAFLHAPQGECPVGQWMDKVQLERADRAGVSRFADSRSAPGLEALLERIASRYNVSPAEIRSPKRSRSLSAPRAALAQAALSSGAATLGEVAAFLGRAPSTVSWLLQRYRTRLDPPRQ